MAICAAQPLAQAVVISVSLCSSKAFYLEHREGSKDTLRVRLSRFTPKVNL